MLHLFQFYVNLWFKKMSAHLDYIRLATWDIVGYPTIVSELMQQSPGGWEHGSWLQYKGWRKEQIFIGHGEQDKKRHTIIQASGNMAQELKEWLMNNCGAWYCTRIDYQVTILHPYHLSLEKIHQSLGAKKTSLISSETQTLYLGKRTSDIFTRLYQKKLAALWLRLEFELKGNRAKGAWVAMLGQKTNNQIFQYYLGRSILPEAAKKHYRDVSVDTNELALTAELTATAEKKLAWLQSIDQAVMLAITDHEIGDRVKILVQSWANYAANLDIMREIE